MASYNELNALIDAYINRNGVQAITGQILNGVLKAMVEQLGRGYTIMGAAIPTTDPGTPDGPECYFASATGTYTDFDGLQVVPGELALLCYTPTDGWTKATIYEGFQEVGATIDGNVGTPSVGVSYADGVLSFDFHNMKGDTGQNGQDGQDGAAAGFGTIGADITGGVGTPGVTVESSGPATAKNLQFHFTNLKGETGVTSVVATVDNTTGTPACTVSLVGQQLTLAFSGLKGAQGDTGSSVDYPFTIVNNLTDGGAAKALSAEMGKTLEGEVSQLEALLRENIYIDITTNADNSYPGKAISNGGIIFNLGTRIVYCKLFSQETTVFYDEQLANYAEIFYAMGGTAGNPTDKTIVSTGAQSGKVVVPAGGRLYWCGLNPANEDYDTTGPKVSILQESIGDYKDIVDKKQLEEFEEGIKEGQKYRGAFRVGSVNSSGQDAGNPTYAITCQFHHCVKGEVFLLPAISGRNYTATFAKYTDASFDSFIALTQGISVSEEEEHFVFDYAGYYLLEFTLGASDITEEVIAEFEAAFSFYDTFAVSEATKEATKESASFPFAFSKKYGIAAYRADPLILDPVELVNGHTYKLIVRLIDAISTCSTCNINVTRNNSTTKRIAEIGGISGYTGGEYLFYFDSESGTDYYITIYSYGRANARFETMLQDVTIDNIVDSGIVARNRYKEAALISVASKSGNENIKVADKLTLLHFSDLHGNTANLANIVTYGDHYSDLLDDIIHTGDSVFTQMSDTNPFVSVEGAENILNVIGNHEAWLNTSDPDYYATEKQTYDKIFAPSIANWGVVQPTGAEENGYCYYYKDFTTAGFRLIVLDSVHWHYRNGTTDSNLTQKTWFESVLADAITQNLRVVCATHYTPQNGIVPVENTGFNVLGTTAGANIADGWFAADEIFGCVDTFIGNGGKFMGWIMGHTHNDYFGTVRNHTGQPIVVIGTSKGSGSGQNKFISNTVAQDNFNVITFESLNAKDYIKIVKIGQDTDIYTRSKNTICYNFTDGVLISTT